MRRTIVVTTTVAAGLLLLPAVAAAHPAFNPNELPPGESVESILVIPHGCAPGGGMPDTDETGGGAEPTTELALQHADRVTVEPQEVTGWQVTDDGEAWVWSDDGGATTDVIELPVVLTIDEGVATGDVIHLRAYQECADGSSFQWVGTPDEEATYPAIKLAASDDGVGTAEPDPDASTDHGEMDPDTGMSESDDLPADEATSETGTDTDEEPSEAADGDDGMDDEEAADEEAAGEEAASDDGGLPTPLVVLLVVIVLAMAAGFVLRSRRG